MDGRRDRRSSEPPRSEPRSSSTSSPARTEGTPLQIATTLAYPLGDILMVAMVVGVVALTGWRPGRTWSLLLAGLTALVVADIAYTLQTTRKRFRSAAGSTRST